MNGARTTFKRKGYLLTALAAAALLAASPGTVAAQNTSGVTITGPTKNTVTEGGTATYTVAVIGYVAAAADAMNPTPKNTVTVTLGDPSSDNQPSSTAGEPNTDLRLGGSSRTVSFETPPNSSTAARRFTASGTITLVTEHDKDAEDEHFTLSFTLEDGGLDTTAAGGTDISLAPQTGDPPTSEYRPGILIIDDDETQTYALSLSDTSKPTELATEVPNIATVNISAVPEHVNGSAALNLYLNPASGFALLGGDSVTVAAGTPPTRTVTQSANDANRKTDKVTLSAYINKPDPQADQLIDSLEIEFADAHALPLVTLVVTDKDGTDLQPQPKSVKEGESIYVKAKVVDDKGAAVTAAEALTIKLAASGGSADGADIEKPADLTVAGNATDSAAPVMVQVRSDEDTGMETLVLAATVSGEDANGKETKTVPNVLSIGIEDATAKKVAPKSDADLAAAVKTAMADAEADGEGFNPGESFTVTGDDLFDSPMEGYTFGLGVSVSGDADAVGWAASGGGVTVTAKKAGEATVTLTATARESASATATGSQDVSNVAHVDIDLTVTNKVLTLTLEAASVMDGNVVEGEDYDITVTANRAVLEDTEVTFDHDTATSEVDMRDYSIQPVTIMSGEMMATATLMVAEDNTDDAGHAMGEKLHLYAEGGGAMSNTLELTIWDEAVPALPLIAQLLLALFLMAGGSRLYRRRQG